MECNCRSDFCFVRITKSLCKVVTSLKYWHHFHNKHEITHLISALQLAEYTHGDGIEVIFAGGRRGLMHRNQTDPEYPDKNGRRLDGRDLIQEWLDKHSNSQYVWNKNQFDKIDEKKVDHVMGMLWLNTVNF